MAMVDNESRQSLAACYKKAYDLEHGFNGKADFAKAAELYLEAARKGYALAQYAYAKCCMHGRGVRTNAAEAVNWYKQAAKQGLFYAAFVVGECYRLGKGVPADKLEAIKWYSIASEAGMGAADLAIDRINNPVKENTEKDIRKDSGKDTRSASDHSSRYGSRYDSRNTDFDADTDPEDTDTDSECYGKQDDTEDYDRRAGMSRSSRIYDRTSKRARTRKKKVKDAEAIYAEAYKYEHGDGVQQDYSKAMDLYEEAACCGYPVAQYQLGLFYLNGKVSKKKNPEKGKMWLDMAIEAYCRLAAEGDAKYQCELAGCYTSGTGVPEDDVQAFYWYLASADQGYGTAQYRLAGCYEEGWGTDRNLKQALKWYTEAYNNGVAAAEESINRVSRALKRP